ncbi:hypothetical protein [Nocardia sp. NPDC127526]|uniref:hypothetical protein n=1 Tax=Nocardia sp. NPDC127526 TaxID=3345393 RepID=UPI0036387BC7
MTSTNEPPDTRTPVQIHHKVHGMVTVPGDIVAEHFAIVPELDSDGAPALFGLQLIHIPTGAWVPVDEFPHLHRDELRLLAEKLTSLPIDWATAIPGSWRSEQLSLIHGALEEWETAKAAALREVVGDA